jgi:hypothetical protein
MKMMLRKLICFCFIFWPASFYNITFSQTIDSTTFSIDTRQSFYSYEESGEMLLFIPQPFRGKSLEINLKIEGRSFSTWKGKAGKSILRVPFPITLTPSVYNTVAEIVTVPSNSIKYSTKTKLIILKYKPNEVKTDRLSGGLLVNKKQFFPFGFYTYSPVSPTLPEEEVVKGFNMISPYQKIIPETLEERRSYMDRCAQLGMKVHYNLLSVSGGGGVGSNIEGISDEEKNMRLAAEIKTFMNHPALLAWYISDEPNGNKITKEQLENIYKTVKEIDPWHPVSIVFMAPFLASKKYINAFDIVMADPYPVPDLKVSLVGDISKQLKEEFNGKKPVWIVTQAFGGGEWWKREPTLQEIRSMTYQAIINGATGIKYFVRQGLNYFPKSTSTWSECGRMATEIAELTPWLLSEENPPGVRIFSDNIVTTSRVYKDKMIILAVNTRNEPARAEIWIEGGYSGKARVLFENRNITINNGQLIDILSSLGSQVYLIDLNPGKKQNSTSVNNLITDPGFEDLSTPGLPVCCYARPGGDRGATFFTDTREQFKGIHSLRLITPKNDKSAIVRFFPFQVSAGSSYMVSLWAKADPEQRPYIKENRNNKDKMAPDSIQQWVEVSVGEFSRARFVPDGRWRKYVTFITIPSDTLTTFKTNLFLKMPGAGVAWFDDIEVIEDVLLKNLKDKR